MIERSAGVHGGRGANRGVRDVEGDWPIVNVVVEVYARRP